MTIATHNLGMSYLDDIQLIAELIKYENNIPVPYADSRGKATIGIGVNITLPANMALVLDQLGVFFTYLGQVNAGRATAGLPALTAAESNQIYNSIVADFESVVSSHPISGNGTGKSPSERNLQDALDAKLSSYLGNTSSKFKLDDLGVQAKAIIKEIILGYSVGPFVDTKGKQGRLDAILGNSLAHDTKEYEAIMSMFYNAERTVPAGGGLATAIQNGNRAEAWFEIRYNTNRNSMSATPPSDAWGIANRRYKESELFNLYDSAAPTLTEAKQVYQMFTLHRSDILKYEGLYSPININASSTAIRDQLDPACAQILVSLNTNPNPDVVNAYQSWVNAGNNPATFNSTNLYLDPGRNGSKEIFSLAHSALLDSRQYDVLGKEIANNAILIGEGDASGKGGDMLRGGIGNDLIIGGSGNDVLYGGGGHDYMAGGAGNDTYILSGGGAYTLEDKQGFDRILFNGNTLSSFFIQADGTYKSQDGLFSAAWSGTDLIVTDIATGDTATLNQNFTSGDFGITLTTAPVAPAYATTILGDIIPTDNDPATAGIQAVADANGNPVGAAGAYADILAGTAGNDHILSGALDDNVGGGAGDDWIEAGTGNDYALGQGGNDIIEGGAGSDILTGDAGNDVLYGNVKISVAQAIADGNVINLNGSSGTGNKGDWLSGGTGNDTLIAGADNDVLAGGGGNDLIVAGAGDDYILGDAEYTAQYLLETTPRFSIGGVNWYHTSAAPFDWTATPDAAGTYVFSPSVGATDPVLFGREKREAANDAERRMAA